MLFHIHFSVIDFLGGTSAPARHRTQNDYQTICDFGQLPPKEISTRSHDCFTVCNRIARFCFDVAATFLADIAKKEIHINTHAEKAE